MTGRVLLIVTAGVVGCCAVLCIESNSSSALADPCSGQKDGACSNARDCDIATNPDCATKIMLVPGVKDCLDGEAADNCVYTDGTNICASRWECSKNMAGDACTSSGQFLGEATVSKIDDGGPCEISQDP